MNTKLKDPDYEGRKKVAIKAFEKGCLIFAQDSQRFYTPRDFIDSSEKVVSKKIGIDEYLNVTFMYPKHALGRKLEDLHKAQEEFNYLMQSLINAFEFHPLKGLKKKSR